MDTPCRSPHAGCHCAKTGRTDRNGAVWRYLGAQRAVAPGTQLNHPLRPDGAGQNRATARHIAYGYQNGLSRGDGRIIYPLAFYAGWPAAASALTCLNAQEAPCL